MTAIEEYKEEEDLSRDEAFSKFLKPIKWGWDWPIRARWKQVTKRRKQVKRLMPFLTEEEKAMANDWLEREQHSELWD